MKSALIAGVLLILFGALLLTPAAFAQTSSPSAIPTLTQNYQGVTTIIPTSPQYTDLLLNNLFHTFSCVAVGQSIIGQQCLSYQVVQDAQGKMTSVPVLSSANLSYGVLGATSSLLSGLYLNPPIRTTNYLASVGSSFGLVKEAHAQVVGSGAAVLDPILRLWQVSRNISYIIMIIIFMVIGLMVMFRQRINPQTVITAQAALPGLVIGLILITLSYFLAALLTDTAFLGTNIVGHFFSAAKSQQTNQNLVDEVANDNALSIFSLFVGAIGRGEIVDAIDTVINSMRGETQTLVRAAAGIIAFQTGNAVGSAIPFVGDVAGPILGTIGAVGTALLPGQVLGTVFWIIAAVVLIYTMIRLLLRLINSYLAIIFLTITAPFHFLAASLPGRQSIAVDWARNMLCNALAFPAVMAVFYFVAFLLGTSEAPFRVTNIAELSGRETLPLFGGMNMKFIRALLAFGALLATPAIPDILCKTIGKQGAAGQMIEQAINTNLRGGQDYGRRVAGGLGQAGQSIGRLFDQPEYYYNPRTEQSEVRMKMGGARATWEKVTGLGGTVGRVGRFITRRRIP